MVKLSYPADARTRDGNPTSVHRRRAPPASQTFPVFGCTNSPLRVVELFQRRDFGHMDVETTFDDPRMYTKAFTIKVSYNLLADSDIFESFCQENEKDRPHLTKP